MSAKKKYKAVKLFPDLYNKRSFIFREHPEYHPDMTAYSEYWEEQETRCLEGFWGLDRNEEGQGGYRYMPGNLYYYVNFCIIEDEDENGNTTDIINPMLRDVEWLLSYGWLTCRGFSGFSNDPEHTSHRLIGKLEKGEELTPKEVIQLDKKKDRLTKADGSYKKYVEAREYLYRTFDEPLGKPYYDNEALNFFVLGSRGFGKDLSIDELVYTEDGPIEIGKVKIGDKIYGADGKLTTVLDRFDYDDQMQYEVKFADGRSLTCGNGHLWKVFNTISRKWEVKELNDIMLDYLIEYDSGRVDRRYFIPYCNEIDYTEKNLEIDPYYLGLWLGDGSKHRTDLTTEDEEIVEYIYDYADELECQVSINVNSSKTCPTYHISKGQIGRYKSYDLREWFKKYNLFNNKHIPDQYKYGSIEQRMELVRGLLDSDGYINKQGNIEFVSTIPQLSIDLCSILDSLGIRNKTTIKDTGYKIAYRTLILTSKDVFKLSRKRERLNTDPSSYAKANREKVAIVSIEPVGVKPSVCIAVDNEDKLFVAGDNYVVTHNSYYCANAVIGHEFNFFGKKYFDDTYLVDPAAVEIFVGSALGSKSSDLLKKFSGSEEWQKKHFGAYGENEDFIPGYFYNNTTGTLAPNNSQSPFRHAYKYMEGGTWLGGGSGTKIQHGVYTSENPQAAVGTRPTVMVIEEVGLLKNLLEVHSANETCQVRRTKFGSSFYIGTGGNMEKIVESKIVFEDPTVYNFLPYKDHWENRSKPIGFFIPAYYVDNTFKDENGNTDLDAALAEEVYQRGVREKANNSLALDGYMMARPLVPSEMFLSPTANVFPTAKLRERLARVETEDIYKIHASIGSLHYIDKEKQLVRWEEDTARVLKPITEMNLDSYQGNIQGAITIYEHPPEIIPPSTYRKSLYKVVYDPIKDDGEGTSLASILVYKGHSEDNWALGVSDSIVAEYIGRYDRVNDIHEIAIKLALYFGAKIMVENNLPDFIRYSKLMGKYWLLQYSPYDAISKVIKNPGRKYEVGITMGKGLNIHCEQLLRQWLLEPWKTYDDGTILYNLDKIKSPRLLKEFISYDRERNFDHISAMKLLALWISQEMVTPIKKEDVSKTNSLNDFVKELARRNNTRFKQNKPFHAY